MLELTFEKKQKKIAEIEKRIEFINKKKALMERDIERTQKMHLDLDICLAQLCKEKGELKN